jgi:hypothetical protein
MYETGASCGTILCFCSVLYCPHITSWSPQGMRVLRQCKVLRAEIMFVTIQRENILPQRKKWTNLLQFLNCPIFAVRIWITTPFYRWPIGNLPSTRVFCTRFAVHKGHIHPAGINSWSVDSRQQLSCQYVELPRERKNIVPRRIIFRSILCVSLVESERRHALSLHDSQQLLQ